MPTMHRALAVYDVLTLVFSYWDDDDGNKRDLLNFALCCRDWELPALDVLWRRLPGVIPLIKLFDICELYGCLVSYRAYESS